MDRNSIIGLVLILGILFGYNYFFGPNPEDTLNNGNQVDSTAVVADTLVSTSTENLELVKDVVEKDSTQLELETLLKQQQYGSFADAINKEAKGEIIVVNTPKLELHFSTKGAKLVEAIVKDFETYKGAPLKLFNSELSEFNVVFEGNGEIEKLNTKDLVFNYSGSSNINIDQGEQTIEFVAGEGENKVEIAYTLSNSYYLGLEIETPKKESELVWSQVGYNNEKHLETERSKSSVFYRLFEEQRDYLSERSSDEENLEQEPHWIAFKQDFFSTALISRQGQLKTAGNQIAIEPLADTIHTKAYLASLVFNDNKANFDYYLGPNDYDHLTVKEVEEFDRIIDFGWGIFGWVNKYLILNVFKMLDGTGMSYGIIILILTLLIKLALSPLTYKNFLSSAKMRVLKPQIDEINEKHKNSKDAMKKQQDIMALYRSTGVNPMAGCLPMLLQMPILYAMFRFFPASIELRHEAFLWADDLSSYDSILSIPDIPLYGDHVSLFTLMLAVSTFFYSKLNMNNTAMPQQQEGMPQINMKMMTYIFPFMMLFFFNNYSAGLSYYYFTSNVISIAQMFVIRKYIVDEKKILAKIEENKKKKKGKSKFQKRMEDMAKKRGIDLPKN